MVSGDRRQLGRDYVWNTAASLMSSLSLVIMLTAVTRTAGIAAAGVYSLAIAVGQQFQTLGMYEVRTYHVTDVSGRYAFGNYLATRIVTTVLMIGGIVAATMAGASPRDGLVSLLVAMLRIFDAVEDVFYSEFQRNGRLDIGGRACFWRITTTTGVFVVTLVVTHDLMSATILTLVMSSIAFVLLYLPAARRLFSVRPCWDFSRIWSLLVECLPLFLGSFLAMYLTNAPRYAIEEFLDSQAQGVFAIIYMPAVAINMLSLFVFRPLLTPIASRWVGGDRQGFARLVRRGLVTTSGAFVLVALVSLVAGPWILQLVFNQDVSAYLPELMILVAGGAFNAVAVILYYALTTMRRQVLVFGGYAAAAVVVLVLSRLLVPIWALMGAALSYAGAMLVLALLFLLLSLHSARLAGAQTHATTRR
ncbi:lipopolysaccharide biosynthesis protein [Actinomyces succiniciruminis]|uniref:Brp/Blh beta-carotene 15,15'-monooxygenase n=1 Tax=Actinomyces succiniciruminis TaxID=1522002 RepID=A0A1L7RPU1_9ACTO|nr:lipopolysaccharide biosynthesis protein [Actinomyces succiniciruminis]CED91374.1 Brp/Blh beta-carotene 15,15'-monooxygenase [Actinomyces succiniciruminis]